jgi:thiol-disulfide isomerase/thioredoxin
MIYVVEKFENLIQLVKNNPNKLIVLKCYMPWCGYCKNIEDEYKKMSESTPNVIFLEINMEVDKKQNKGEIANRFKISGYPTFVLIKNEEFLHNVVGANMEGLQDKINNYA